MHPEADIKIEGERKNMKTSSSKLTLFLSLLLLAAVFALTAGTVYAWFSTSRFVSDNTFTTGQLDTSLVLYYWNKESSDENKWTIVPSTGMSSSFYPYFGSLDNMIEMPEDCNVFLKMKVHDPLCANYYYNVMVDEIIIHVYRFINQTYTPVTDNALDYYSAEVPQSCIQNYFCHSAADNLTPSALSSYLPSTGDTIDTPGQSFSDGVYIGNGEWIYIKLELRYEEFMNIIRRVPAEYMPYSIEFVLNLNSETRTADNE
jgi:hypothetical protein